MDYKNLLQKYAQYVCDCEGTDYLDKENGPTMCTDEGYFTVEEVEVLKEITANVTLK